MTEDTYYFFNTFKILTLFYPNSNNFFFQPNTYFLNLSKLNLNIFKTPSPIPISKQFLLLSSPQTHIQSSLDSQKERERTRRTSRGSFGLAPPPSYIVFGHACHTLTHCQWELPTAQTSTYSTVITWTCFGCCFYSVPNGARDLRYQICSQIESEIHLFRPMLVIEEERLET